MNSLHNTLIILALFLSVAAYSAPPEQHVKTAFIDISQGKRIYANGKMQAVVKVYVELMPKVTWDQQVELLEFGTGEELSNLGWTISDTDNGYDHNIGGLRSLSISTINDENEQKYLYVQKFISTTNTNSQIKICFQIQTKKTTTQTYSTCYKAGIERGTGTIFAQRPDAYFASDFEFTPSKTIFRKLANGGPELDIEGVVYSLRPSAYMPRTTRFKMINTKDVQVIDNKTKVSFDANSDNAVMKSYNLEATGQILYMEAYFFQVTDNSTDTGGKSFRFFHVFLDGAGRFPYELVTQNSSESIINILNVKYGRQTFMYKSERCGLSSAKQTYDCTYYDYSTGSLKKKSEPKTIKLDSVRKYTIKIEDNFGNNYDLLWDF